MVDKKLFKRTLLSAAFTLGFAAVGTASAVDWIMLQGTEPVGGSIGAKPWGFVQVNYQKDNSPANTAGAFVPAKLIGPNLNAQSGFQLSHLQFGLRGTGFPLDEHINYMILLEAGNAATNAYGNGSGGTVNNGAVVTDASVTLNYIEGARIRVGMFKTPGSDEGLQSLTSMEYVNFSEMTNQLLLERLPNAGFTPCVAVTGATTCSPGNGPTSLLPTGNTDAYTPGQLQNGAGLNKYTNPVSAFRDTGIQVFDAFKMGNDWKLTYAAMLGQGSGIQYNNVDGKYDTYFYLSTEKNLDGGTGAYKHGLKLFAWNQSGQRLLDNTSGCVPNAIPVLPATPYTCTPTQNAQLYDRKRSGVGVKLIDTLFRVTAEYVEANGMIFEGQDKPNFYFTNEAAGNGADAKGYGWYLDGGWYIPNTKWELDARYDTTELNTGRADEHVFSKWTIGTQYIYNPMSRVTLNYEMRDFKCTGLTAGATSSQCNTANGNLNDVRSKISVQVMSAF